jgi:hypothetical protein
MSHHVTHKDIPEGGEKFDPAKASGLITPLLGLGTLGLLASIYFFWAKPAEFAYSWLFAFFFCFTFVVGGCFWILLNNAANSSWEVSLRRLFEHLANMVPALFVFALPLLIPTVRESLYEWMVHHREAAAHAGGGTVKESLHHMAEENPHLHTLYAKYGYMNMTFWYLRFAAYFLILWYIGRTLRGKSLQQEKDGDIKHTILGRTFACRWLLFFALTATFASVDWVMGIDYNWFSTMWGVYIFAGCAWSSMSLMILLVTYLRSIGYLQKVVTDEHYHLMGKLLFAFTVFWGYIAFSQYFLIWYANITEETRWYLTRNTEGWRWVSIALVLGHFVGPFVLLLSQPRKKKPAVVCAVGIWILLMHMLDIYWNIIPERGPSLGKGVWIAGAWIGDVVAVVTICSLMGYVFLRTLGKYSLYQWRNPRLLESANVVN